MPHFNRRDFLKISLAGAGTLMLPPFFPLAAAAEAEPRFFLLVLMNGGADPSYTFDARPLSMTAAGKIQNHWAKGGARPVPLTGANGQATLTTPLVAPLLPYFRSRFSVLNGVVMTPSFDGHLQNMNFLFTGSPFGGESFLPHLNLGATGRAPASLDGVIPGEGPSITVSNHARVVPLEPGAVASLAESLRKNPAPAPGNPLTDFVRGRLQALSAGNGRFSRGAGLMLSGFDGVPSLHAQLAQLGAVSPGDSAERKAVALAGDCFRLGIARTALYSLPEAFDVHAPDAAKNSPKMFEAAVGRVAAVFRALEEIPFDRQRSLFDVTTVLVASEMGRSMRGDGGAIEGVGTNHNQFGNSMLLGGRGVRPGLVVGATDLPDEKAACSKAHKALDPLEEKLIGRPLDFSTLRAREGEPEEFRIQDHLTMGSVVNTLYKSFGVPPAQYRSLGRNEGTARVLPGLLS